MTNKLIIFMMFISSIAYADISPVTIDDVRDHKKIQLKLNEIIWKINSENSNKATKNELDVINTHYVSTANDLGILRSNLGNIRNTVGDPGGTVADVRTKFIKLMDTLDASPQHTVVTP